MNVNCSMNKIKDLKIELSQFSEPRLRSAGMNWACTAQRPFNFRPTSFTASIDGLKPKSFNQSKQLEMFSDFLGEPRRPMSFGVSSAPNDGRSKLLAAYMMEYHLKSCVGATPVWHDLMGGFACTLLEDHSNASFMVLNNVGPDSSQTKKEKLRDLLEMYADIPKVVVVNGCDPFTFFTLHLRMPMQGLAYLTNDLVKKSVEI